MNVRIEEGSDGYGPETLTVSTISGLSYLDENADTRSNFSTSCDGNNKVESPYSTGSMGSVLSIKSSDAIIQPDGSSEGRDRKVSPESNLSIAVQVAVPFTIAGFGTIGAGVVLGQVQHFDVFVNISQLFILVPSILGLKGNLDMCLASRLSTQANLGNMTVPRELFKMIVGNVALVQVQAIVAAILVSLFAMTAGSIMSGTFDFRDAMLLSASSVMTATISCFILDFGLIGVIFLSHKFHINPDNLATPVAASIGDIVSLTLLSNIASVLYSIHDTHYWVLFTILGIYLIVMLPLWIVVVRHNKYTKTVLTAGWTPVIAALIISGLSGLVLDSAVDQFNGFVVFQPIINGLGGNLVSVQSSKISTMLHQTSLPGILPPHTKQWVAPWTALFKGVPSARTARILILICIPGQLMFVFLADYFNMLRTTVGAEFVCSYIAVGLLQVMMLLYIAHLLIHLMWRFKIDPDSSAIPYLTSLGDFLGSSLLLGAFFFLRYVGYEYDPDNK